MDDSQNDPVVCAAAVPSAGDGVAAWILESITDAFMAFDADWRFTYVNDQSERIMSRTRADLLGRVFWDEFPVAVGSTFEREYRRAVDGQVAVTFEEFYPPLDIWVEVCAYPSPDGLSVFYQDVSARRRDEEALRASEERYRLLVEGARDYVMILLDTQGRITGWNVGAERIMGWSEAEMLGRPADQIFTPEDRAQGVPAQEMQNAAAQGRALDLRWHVRKDGSRFFADGILEGLRGADGHPRGFAKILRDATGTKQAQDALRASEGRLRDAQTRLDAALSAGRIATWDWDLAGGRVVADAGTASLFSLTPEDAAGGDPDAYFQSVHPDDRADVIRAVEDAVARWDVYDVEYRVVLPDGTHRWLAARGRVKRDAAGVAVGLPGVVVDVTERVERERRERFLAGLADRARGMTDPEAVIADAVRSVGAFLGVSRCIFADIDIEADTCAIHPHYRADESVADIKGVVPISAFGAFVVAEYAARRAVAVDDVRTDSVRVPPETVGAYEAVGIRAHITVPVVHSGRLVSCISVHNAAPRQWEPEEVELLGTVVERTWLTVEVTRQECALAHEAEELREAHARTGRILENIADAFFTVDREWRYTYINRQAEALWGRTRAELLGMTVWEAWPDAVGGEFDHQFHRAMMDGATVLFEEFYPPLGAWLEVRAYPSPDGVSVFFQNVNARKALEVEREKVAQTLRESETRFRRMADAIPHIAWTTDVGGAVDYYNQRWYDYSGLSFAQTREWGWASLIHPDDLKEAGGVWGRALQSGAVSEVEYRLRRADGTYRWHLGRSEPVRDGAGRVIHWVGTATDIQGRKEVEERLLAAYRREALLNRIGAAIRSAPDPQRVLETAVRELGQALGADRCYYVAYDQGEDRATAGPEWYRTGLPPLAGEYPMSRFVINRDAGYRAGRTQVVADTSGDPAAQALGLSSLVRVPLVLGPAMTTLAAAMAEGPRTWTEEETVLVEAVAAQTQGALEAVRLRRREHTIAQQLQAALTPPIPDRVPGMALTKYYEAALEEAGVGGDFYDVFPVEKGCTALVVGDVSGKGLAAAAQVATVRNMLRYALYRARTLAGALEGLNALLAEQSLLSGFATLFVGAYDSGAGLLTYVNCGQEPALVRRADGGRVEELPPTGPTLGSHEGASFEEQTVALGPGDAVAVFTDGLTEVGPSRREMLGIEGMTGLLERPIPVDTPSNAKPGGGWQAAALAQHLLVRLIAGVDAAAQGGVMRDDMCLLVGVVEG